MLFLTNISTYPANGGSWALLRKSAVESTTLAQPFCVNQTVGDLPRLYIFIYIFNLYALYRKRYKLGSQLLWNACRNSYATYVMVHFQ